MQLFLLQNVVIIQRSGSIVRILEDWSGGLALDLSKKTTTSTQRFPVVYGH